MKLQLIVLFVVVVALAQAVSNDEWSSYKQKYNKQYSPQEDARHRALYDQSIKEINAHNERFKAGQESYEKGVNQFADMTDEERQSSFGFRP